MTYTIEVRDGHHVVNMAPAEEVNEELYLKILKFATGYSLAEVLAEAFMKDVDVSKLRVEEIDASKIQVVEPDTSELWRTNK